MVSIGALVIHLMWQLAVFYVWKTSFIVSLYDNWALQPRVMSWKKATSFLVLPSPSVTLPVSNLLLCFKGIFKLHFLADLEWNVRETGSPGCVSVRKLNLRQNKKLLQLHSSLSKRHVKVTSNGKQYQSKPRPHTSLPRLNLNETTDCNYRSLCALYMRLRVALTCQNTWAHRHTR